MNAKSIVLKASVVSVFIQILHTKVIFEGSSMIVGLKIQRITPELSMGNNKLYHRSTKLRTQVLVRQGSDLLTKNTLVMISNTTSCDSQYFKKGLVLT